MSYYLKEFGGGMEFNYPPEEAQTIIRDQTYATFLEEIDHPMRESLFVAGNQIPSGKPPFEVDGKKFNQKVIVKYVDSNVFVRLSVGILTLCLIWILGREYAKTYAKIFKLT